MTDAEHIQRHEELHKAFDELMADFIAATGQTYEAALADLLEWSVSQTIYPDHSTHMLPESGGVG